MVPDVAFNDPLLDELNVGLRSIQIEDDTPDAAATAPPLTDHDGHPGAKATPIPLPAPLLVGLAGLGVSAAAARRKRRGAPL